MAIRVALNHQTRHHYAREVWLSPHLVRLRPAPHCRTPILSYSLTVTPADHFINWQQDPYSNYLARLVVPKKTREFNVVVDLVAELTVINPFDFFVEKYAEQYPFAYDPVLARELASYLAPEPAGPKVGEFLAELRREALGGAGVGEKPGGAKPAGGVPTVNFLVDLNQRLQRRIKYLIRLEPGVQVPEHTLTCLSGSCRDSAWLLVQVLRHLGLAARFVSGYLIQLAPDVRPIEGPAGVASDFTDLHAWVEVYLPGAGWVGLDPTSGLLAGEGHIPLACTAEASSAAAITGFFSYDDAAIVAADAGEVAGDSDGKDEFHVSMSVTRVHEDPRVTRPYSDEQWERIDDVGRRVDADLRRGDVRLTTGGEPTFVSVDDADAPEWNGQALGPGKYARGDQLARRLRDRLAPGGFLHHGQGKWYPGESLPRWALGLYWRKDGVPIWKDPRWVADEARGAAKADSPGTTGPTATAAATARVATARDALVFATHLAGRLGANPAHVQAGYEDTWYYLWKEQRLPINVDPLESNLAEKEARDRLARVFQRGLGEVVGYCLPLKRKVYRDGSAAWVSGPWFFRPERMYLVPGDSPMGYRLPLESIPWVSPEDLSHIHARDPWEERGPLPARAGAAHSIFPPAITGAPAPRDPLGFVEQVLGAEGIVGELTEKSAEGAAAGTAVLTALAPVAERVAPPAGRGGGGEYGGSGEAVENGDPGGRDAGHPADRHAAGNGGASPSRPAPPQPGRSARDTVRTALCTEVRGGILRVFVPPLRHAEDYLDLVAAIEDTAAAMKLPVLVEGYPPPPDARLNEIKVTPDPGVIEINTLPVGSWEELVAQTAALHEEARQCRLGAEKFLVDGRHAGSGGGNHIVFGGPTPADSPFLRRPDLLRSLLGYWHNHPSLSYLFSGLFVGPTSQAPRVDEARNDQVYELELAFKQVPEPDQRNLPPWLVDRIFRNLLVDSTGNTHRAEFCIDKLYSPDGPTGRLGLLEMRGFEMPPHPRMSLTQHLLLRALIARFWHEPYRRPLARWRTEIHDRFMLPHFVRQDLEDVTDELNEAGYGFRADWFAPHLEFRFPRVGSITQRGIALEIRQAIEPWHVLGEVPGIGSTVRYVDSSLERVQVLIDGMTDGRHQILCNGVRVPLHPTGTNGQFVAGVRFRAWQPAACLHPTIGRHSPLVFDVYDTWSGRSIGGCKYSVSHPGGRNYRAAPVNAYEAESRRVARFFKFGHTPGPMTPVEAEPTREFPLTLDLRRYSK